MAYNSQFTYVRAKVGTETYLLESSLLPKVAETCGWENVETLGEISGAELGELRYVHPFIDKTGPVLAGDTFVENSTGSGFVHIAPGHGLEDYGLGSQNGLPIYSPVDDAGKLAHTDDLPAEAQMPAELVGQSILEKNGTSEPNEAVLALLHLEPVELGAVGARLLDAEEVDVAGALLRVVGGGGGSSRRRTK